MNTNNNAEGQPKVPLAGNIPQPRPVATNEELARNQVLASRQIDKKAFLGNVQPNQTARQANEKKPIFSFLKNFDFSKLTLAKSVPRAYLGVGIIVLCFFCFILFTLYSDLDDSVIKNTLEGEVTDTESNEKISGAKVSIGEKSETTDANGKYSIGGLGNDNLKVKVEAEGYFTIEEEVPVGSTLLSYTTTKNFQLEKIVGSQIKGKFIISEDSDPELEHDFTLDSLFINDKAVEISKDGTFLANVVEGTSVTFKYESANFLDITRTFPIDVGLSELEDIILEPAGEINADFISFIREDVILDAEIIAEGVLPSKVSIGEEGKMKIADLEIGRTYKIRVNAPKYLTRDYEVTIKQGINLIPDFRLVEEGQVIFLDTYTVTDLDSPQFFKSDLDGKNKTVLTQVHRMEPVAQYFNADENIIYFLTAKDNVDSTIRSDVYLAYSFKVDTGELTKLTNNTANLGTVIPNFRAKKLVDITLDGTNRNSRKLILMDLAGRNRTDIRSIPAGEFSNIVIADKGNYVYFYEKNTTSGVSSLYQFDVVGKKVNFVSDRNNIQVYDVSEDGTRVLYSILNDTTSFSDLLYTDTKTQETRTIAQNFKGDQFRFIDGSNKDVIFYKEKDGEEDIYTVNIETGSEQRITNLEPSDRISYVYQEGKYVFYITQKGLNVIDILKPNSFKLVDGSVDYYSGYDYSN